MEFRILGSIEASDADRIVEIASSAQRRLLAILLVHGGSVVSKDRLADLLEISDSGLRTTVSRLRTLLGDHVVATAPPGYVLASDDVDAERFEHLLERARYIDPVQALAILDEALGLWRGPALAEFADEDWARPEVARLTELRAGAIEDRAEALLAMDRTSEVVATMERHVAQHPFRDRPRRLLMRALAVQGRETEALRVYQEYRDYLGQEGGLEPSELTRTLETDIALGRYRWDESTIPPATAGGSPAGPSGNLVHPVSSFVGRDDELTNLATDLKEHRLITLTGVGGVGKTRLALETAADAAGLFTDGAWWCELDPIRQPNAVAHAVAQTLGIRLQTGMSAVEAIVEAVSHRQALLLVLDNCEHLLDPVADLVDRIIRANAGVVVLATSREPLAVDGERIRAVRPLDPSTDGLQLFTERAIAVDEGFDGVTERGAVVELCRQLDGLPLAIELAAAHLTSFTVTELIEHFGHSSRRPRRGRRGMSRHETLRAAVQWSHDLLSPGERMLFNRLSVFAGGFDLAGAQAVWHPTATTRLGTVQLLGDLVDKSMVVAERAGTGMRYRVLETLRHFGTEQLDRLDETEEVRAAHKEHYVDLAVRAGEMTRTDGWNDGKTLLETEWDNLRAAMSCAVDTRDFSGAERLLVGTIEYARWCARHEAGQWAEWVLDAAPHGAVVGSGAYAAAAMGRWLAGDYVKSVELASRGLNVPGSVEARGACCFQAAYSSHFAGNGDGASDYLHRLDREPHLPLWYQGAREVLSVFGIHSGQIDLDTAREHLARARALASAIGNAVVDWSIAYMSAIVAFEGGDRDEFRTMVTSSLRIAEAAGAGVLASMSLTSLAFRGTGPESVEAARRALEHAQSSRDWAIGWTALEGLAIKLVETDDLEGGAMILGFLERFGIGNVSYARRRRAALATITAADVGRAFMNRGAELERDDLLDFGLTHLDMAS